jgi:hypothetical protein
MSGRVVVAALLAVTGIAAAALGAVHALSADKNPIDGTTVGLFVGAAAALIGAVMLWFTTYERMLSNVERLGGVIRDGSVGVGPVKIALSLRRVAATARGVTERAPAETVDAPSGSEPRHSGQSRLENQADSVRKNLAFIAAEIYPNDRATDPASVLYRLRTDKWLTKRQTVLAAQLLGLANRALEGDDISGLDTDKLLADVDRGLTRIRSSLFASFVASRCEEADWQVLRAKSARQLEFFAAAGQVMVHVVALSATLARSAWFASEIRRLVKAGRGTGYATLIVVPNDSRSLDDFDAIVDRATDGAGADWLSAHRTSELPDVLADLRSAVETARP